jgi:hypothetical protein
MDDLAVEMRCHNQPVVVAPDVKYQHLPPAANLYPVRVRIGLPHVHQVPPGRRFDELAPGIQMAGRRGMFPPRRHQKFLTNNPHEYNLSSFANFVKPENPEDSWQDETLSSRGTIANHAQRKPLSKRPIVPIVGMRSYWKTGEVYLYI